MRTECEENPVLQRDLEEIAQSSVPFEKLAGKTVFVTGATGLIGSQIVRALGCRNRLHGDNIHLVVLARSYEKAEKLFDRINAKQAVMTMIETFLNTIETGLDGINVALDLLNGLLDILSGNFENLKDNPLLEDLKEFGQGFLDILNWITNPSGSAFKSFFGSGIFGTSSQDKSSDNWLWSALNSIGIGTNNPAVKSENNTTNTQNNNVTNNFYGTTTDEQVDKIGGSIQKFRMWTPKVT